MATHDAGYWTGRRSNRIQDWANLILAAWLFISPWVLQFGNGMAGPAGTPVDLLAETGRAAWNAWVVGAVVCVAALSAIGRAQTWQEYLNMVLGAWLLAAPWALGFTLLRRASWDHWLVGAFILVLSLWGLSTVRGATPATVGAAVDQARHPPPR